MQNDNRENNGCAAFGRAHLSAVSSCLFWGLPRMIYGSLGMKNVGVDD